MSIKDNKDVFEQSTMTRQDVRMTEHNGGSWWPCKKAFAHFAPLPDCGLMEKSSAVEDECSALCEAERPQLTSDKTSVQQGSMVEGAS